MYLIELLVVRTIFPYFYGEGHYPVKVGFFLLVNAFASSVGARYYRRRRPYVGKNGGVCVDGGVYGTDFPVSFPSRIGPLYASRSFPWPNLAQSLRGSSWPC